MEVKRKISVRKILQLLLSVVTATCCVIAMVSASSIEGERVLKSMPIVHIKNDRKYHFVEQKEIMDLAIYNRNVDILHTPVSKLDLRGIEQAIKADAWVEDAQVFVDIDRVMHIYVTQRVPVARVFKQDGNSYYIDSTMHDMPISDNYTYYTMVVTNAPAMSNDSVGMALKKQIVTLVKAIQTDSFWSAQVSQIIMDSTANFELMPVLGNQRILFGDTSNMKEKFKNLLAFYRNVLNRIGWDKYETLDVRFKNQVVAAPSLPYKGPVDKAIANMNWITSIEITEAQKDSMKAREINAVARVKVDNKAATHTTTKAVSKAISPTKEGQSKQAAKPSSVQQPSAKAAAGSAKTKAADAKKVTQTKNSNKEKDKHNTAKRAVAGKGGAAKETTSKGAKPNKKTESKKQLNKTEKKKTDKDGQKGKGAAKYIYPEKK